MRWTIVTKAGEVERGNGGLIWVEYSGHYGVSAAQVLAEAIELWLKGDGR